MNVCYVRTPVLCYMKCTTLIIDFMDVGFCWKFHCMHVCALQQPKKMIRYLDSKVVSIKGEKFTEVKKAEDVSMKSTYINLKPARQYRFH